MTDITAAGTILSSTSANTDICLHNQISLEVLSIRDTALSNLSTETLEHRTRQVVPSRVRPTVDALLQIFLPVE